MLLGMSAYLSVYSKQETQQSIDQKIILVYQVHIKQNKFYNTGVMLTLLLSEPNSLFWGQGRGSWFHTDHRVNQEQRQFFCGYILFVQWLKCCA